MKAAVVHDFQQAVAASRTFRTPSPASARSSSRSKPAGCATPTSTPRMATGRSSRPRRSCPATKRSDWSSASAQRSEACTKETGSPSLGSGWACGACEYCASGRETLCPNQQMTGYTVDGGYAEYVRANASFVGRVPDGVDPLDAAPLSCAGVTTYKAVKVSGARSSDLVAIFGIGGLGHLALQYARIAGASVAAVDLVDANWPWPESWAPSTPSTLPSTTRSRPSRRWAGPTSPSRWPFRRSPSNRPTGA